MKTYSMYEKIETLLLYWKLKRTGLNNHQIGKKIRFVSCNTPDFWESKLFHAAKHDIHLLEILLFEINLPESSINRLKNYLSYNPGDNMEWFIEENKKFAKDACCVFDILKGTFV